MFSGVLSIFASMSKKILFYIAQSPMCIKIQHSVILKIIFPQSVQNFECPEPRLILKGTHLSPIRPSGNFISLQIIIEI